MIEDVHKALFRYDPGSQKHTFNCYEVWYAETMKKTKGNYTLTLQLYRMTLLYLVDKVK